MYSLFGFLLSRLPYKSLAWPYLPFSPPRPEIQLEDEVGLVGPPPLPPRSKTWPDTSTDRTVGDILQVPSEPLTAFELL